MTSDGPWRIVSALINRNLSQSETAQRELAALEGQHLTVRVEGLPLTLYLNAAGGELLVSGHHTGAPAATVAGTPLALLGLLGKRSPDAQSLRRLGVRLDGDEQVARAFARLLARARPELEEELSTVIGDVAAHQIGNALRALHAFGERTLASMTENSSEFLQQESRVVPSRWEVRAFCDDVDRIRDDVERAAARVRQLQQGSAGKDD